MRDWGHCTPKTFLEARNSGKMQAKIRAKVEGEKIRNFFFFFSSCRGTLFFNFSILTITVNINIHESIQIRYVSLEYYKGIVSLQNHSVKIV